MNRTVWNVCNLIIKKEYNSTLFLCMELRKLWYLVHSGKFLKHFNFFISLNK